MLSLPARVQANIIANHPTTVAQELCRPKATITSETVGRRKTRRTLTAVVSRLRRASDDNDVMPRTSRRRPRSTSTESTTRRRRCDQRGRRHRNRQRDNVCTNAQFSNVLTVYEDASSYQLEMCSLSYCLLKSRHCILTLGVAVIAVFP